jgi:hypothetical protein
VSKVCLASIRQWSPTPLPKGWGSSVSRRANDIRPRDDEGAGASAGPGAPPRDQRGRDGGAHLRSGRRYLGDDLAEWPDLFRVRLQDLTWELWTVTPTSGVVVAYPHFDEHKLRWQDLRDSPIARVDSN